MIKKALLSCASIFLICQSYKLLINLEQVEITSWPIAIFVGWIFNLFITGIFAFAGFAFPTQKAAPDSYYTIYNPKRLKQVYELLKVDWFRKMLLATLWKNKKQRKGFFNGKKEGLLNFAEQSMKSEFGHLIPLFIITGISIYFIAIGSVKLGLCSLVINFIGNFYPVILQRHHRMRIQRIDTRRLRG